MKKTILVLMLFGIFIGISSDEVPNLKVDEHVFDNLKEEYKLVSYFLSPNQRRYYKKLDKVNKWDYISAFWKAQDPIPATEENEFIDKLIARIGYCNQHYSHFKDGWKTDMGRVLIKHGKPFEILKLNTGTDTKYTQKDFQIWKFRISDFRTYLFIDLQQNGDYRLIYSDGDEREGSWADWQGHIGSDFDESLLQ